MNAAAFFAARPGPWLMLPHALDRLRAALDQGVIRLGPDPTDPPIPTDLIDRPWPGYRVGKDGIATLAIKGPILGSDGLIDKMLALILNGTLTPQVMAAAEDARTNKAVKALLLDVDSPGGEGTGVRDAAEAIRAVADRKPVAAHVSGFGASAGYWLAAGAPWIVASPTAYTGSIGAYVEVIDDAGQLEQRGLKRQRFVSQQSPHKIADPETEDGKASWQEFVDSAAQEFLAHLALLLGTSPLRVMEDMGQGDILIASEAYKVGLIHQIGTRADALKFLAKALKTPNRGGTGPDGRTGRAKSVMRASDRLVQSIRRGA